MRLVAFLGDREQTFLLGQVLDHRLPHVRRAAVDHEAEAGHRLVHELLVLRHVDAERLERQRAVEHRREERVLLGMPLLADGDDLFGDGGNRWRPAWSHSLSRRVGRRAPFSYATDYIMRPRGITEFVGRRAPERRRRSQGRAGAAHRGCCPAGRGRPRPAGPPSPNPTTCTSQPPRRSMRARSSVIAPAFCQRRVPGAISHRPASPFTK